MIILDIILWEGITGLVNSGDCVCDAAPVEAKQVLLKATFSCRLVSPPPLYLSRILGNFGFIPFSSPAFIAPQTPAAP